MKIAIGEASFSAGALRERGAGTDAQRWRAELERAQWQARLRYGPARDAGRGATGQAQTASDDSPARAAAPARPPNAVPSGDRATQPKPARPAALASAAEAAPLPQVAAAADADAAPTAVPSPAAGAARSRILEARAPASGEPVPPLPFELPHWPASAVHVCLQGQRLSVVLRDAQLDPSAWPALRERLRLQCEACGLLLADLTINGAPVEAPSPVD